MCWTARSYKSPIVPTRSRTPKNSRTPPIPSRPSSRSGSVRSNAQVAELFDSGGSPFESGTVLLAPLSDTDPKLLQMALVHELTHAAFPSPRPWIYEGLAHFAQAAYREHQESRSAALDFMGLHRTAVVDAEKAFNTDPKDSAAKDESLISTMADEFYRSKAAYVWWMLRDLLGEEPLKRVLAAYNTTEDRDP